MGPDRSGPEGSGHRSGFVAVVGRPNAGKSTLVNRLVGEHVAIVSATAQTTRHEIRGVATLPCAQIVFVDTPGLHKPRDPLGEALNRRVEHALGDVDLVLHVVDASVPIGRGDVFVSEAADRLAPVTPRVLALSKIDRVNGGGPAASAAAEAAGLGGYDAVAPVSGLSGEGIDGLVDVLIERLPEGPRYYPAKMVTDQPMETRIGELVREAVLVRVREEVPHEVAVQVTGISKRPSGALTDVEATVVVDRQSQKGIIIGKRGSMLTAIGTAARPAVEALIGGPVYLRLVVRCRRHWRDDPSLLRRFGYSDG